MPEAADLATDPVVVIYATFPDLAVAKNAARHLVEARLAACVNIITAMTAVYRWQGAIEEAVEVVVIAKTRRSLAAAVTNAICANHPYDTPAVVVLEIVGGSQRYLDWVRVETGPTA